MSARITETGAGTGAYHQGAKKPKNPTQQCTTRVARKSLGKGKQKARRKVAKGRVHQQQSHRAAAAASSSSASRTTVTEFKDLFFHGKVPIPLEAAEKKFIEKIAKKYVVSSIAPVVQLTQYHSWNLLNELREKKFPFKVDDDVCRRMLGKSIDFDAQLDGVANIQFFFHNLVYISSLGTSPESTIKEKTTLYNHFHDIAKRYHDQLESMTAYFNLELTHSQRTIKTPRMKRFRKEKCLELIQIVREMQLSIPILEKVFSVEATIGVVDSWGFSNRLFAEFTMSKREVFSKMFHYLDYHTQHLENAKKLGFDADNVISYIKAFKEKLREIQPKSHMRDTLLAISVSIYEISSQIDSESQQITSSIRSSSGKEADQDKLINLTYQHRYNAYTTRVLRNLHFCSLYTLHNNINHEFYFNINAIKSLEIMLSITTKTQQLEALKDQTVVIPAIEGYTDFINLIEESHEQIIEKKKELAHTITIHQGHIEALVGAPTLDNYIVACTKFIKDIDSVYTVAELFVEKIEQIHTCLLKELEDKSPEKIQMDLPLLQPYIFGKLVRPSELFFLQISLLVSLKELFTDDPADLDSAKWINLPFLPSFRKSYLFLPVGVEKLTSLLDISVLAKISPFEEEKPEMAVVARTDIVTKDTTVSDVSVKRTDEVERDDSEVLEPPKPKTAAAASSSSAASEPEFVWSKGTKSRNILTDLKDANFHIMSQKGSHIKLKRNTRVVIIPNHPTLPIGTLRSVMSMANGLSQK